MGWPQRVRRPGGAPDGAGDRRRRDGARRRAAGASTAWAWAWSPDADRPRHRGAEAALLPKILTAEEMWCQLYSEPNAGSDLASLRTQRSAIEDGEYYVVNGQKIWTSAGFTADLGMLLARTDPHVPKHQGISYFIVDMHTPGIEVGRCEQITGDAEFCEVFFTDVRIPAENMIGKEGEGWRWRADHARLRARRQRAERRHRPAVGAGPLDSHVSVRRRMLDDRARAQQARAACWSTSRCMRARGLAHAVAAEKGKRPGAESSVRQAVCSEMDKRHQELYPGDPGAVRPADGVVARRVRRAPDGLDHSGEPVPDTWVFPLRLVARADDPGRDLGNSAEHHRRARAGTAARAASGPRGMTPFYGADLN